MLPDPGCYKERYRMAAGSAVGLFTGLMTIGLAFLTGAPWVVGIVIAAAFLALMGPGLAVRRMIALRADVPPNPGPQPQTSASAVVVTIECLAALPPAAAELPAVGAIRRSRRFAAPR
jgi:hypothetical protein